MNLTIRPVGPRRPMTEKEIEEAQKEQFAKNVDNAQEETQ